MRNSLMAEGQTRAQPAGEAAAMAPATTDKKQQQPRDVFEF